METNKNQDFKTTILKIFQELKMWQKPRTWCYEHENTNKQTGNPGGFTGDSHNPSPW